MNELLTIVLYASAAGVPIFVGALLSCLEEPFGFSWIDRLNHWVVAFGGGALVSAIAFALLPDAMEHLDILPISLCFIAGTLVFLAIDLLAARAGASLAQVISMLMDYLPEALALGASFSRDHRLGLLMALFIGLQNLPEGFNSYREIRQTSSPAKTLAILFALSWVGIFAALTGNLLLASRDTAVGAIMAFASGGILYLIFQDIAPLSKRKNDWVPATGASLGFLLGMLGQMILG